MDYRMSNEIMNEFFDYITGLVNDDVLVKTARSSYVTYYLNGRKVTGYPSFSKIITDTKIRHNALWMEIQVIKKRFDRDIKFFISRLIHMIVIKKINRRKFIRWLDTFINHANYSDDDDDEDE
jgi:hypothetical protein